MADLQRDDRNEGRTATSTGPHTTRDDRDREGDAGHETRDDLPRDASSERTSAREGASGRLLDADERGDLRERWDALQGRFVDDPSGSTHLADELLRDTRDRITRRWEERHREITDRWEGRDDLTTEDLRTTLRRYRDAFEQLLSSS